MLASIPSPSFDSIDIGPFSLNLYGLLIALGVVAAIWLLGRRFEQRGVGTMDDASGIGLDVVVVLVGSILSAGMNLAVRRMPARSSNYAVVFYLSLFGAIFYAAVGGPSVKVPTPAEFGLFLVLGFIALGVHTCVTYGFRFASSMLIGALDYTRIIWAILIGYLFFSEQPDLIEFVGIALIILSGWVVIRSPKASGPQNPA